MTYQPVTEQVAPAAIPLTRLDSADPELLEELLAGVREIAEQAAFTLGPVVEQFETGFASFCNSRFAVGVSSGTEAIALALRALEVGPGDQVIVPSNSFIATAEAVSAVGARPLLVDVDPESHLLTAQIVADSLTPEVRCIVPVHLYGSTVDLGPILELAQATGVHVVEDACQAHGALYEGQPVGSFGAFGSFSFYPTKNLGGWGDGGAVVTSDPELADRVRLLRAHGEHPRYRHRIVGTTARLDAIQAAVLGRKLPRLPEWNEQRRRLGTRLRELLSAQEGGSAGAVELIDPPFAGADHVYHLFVVRTDARDALREHLRARGIGSAVHYPTPIHLTEAYAGLGLRRGDLPACERASDRICSLPLFPGMTDEELERVADAVLDFAQARAPTTR